MAVAFEWVSRIITVAFEMVLPGLGGVWADQYFGTRVVFTLVGFAGGLTLAIWHLMRMTARQETSQDSFTDEPADD
jgi:hypothetical protein